jgi:hypothetical protein
VIEMIKTSEQAEQIKSGEIIRGGKKDQAAHVKMLREIGYAEDAEILVDTNLHPPTEFEPDFYQIFIRDGKLEIRGIRGNMGYEIYTE